MAFEEVYLKSILKDSRKNGKGIASISYAFCPHYYLSFSPNKEPIKATATVAVLFFHPESDLLQQTLLR